MADGSAQIFQSPFQLLTTTRSRWCTFSTDIAWSSPSLECEPVCLAYNFSVLIALPGSLIALDSTSYVHFGSPAHMVLIVVSSFQQSRLSTALHFQSGLSSPANHTMGLTLTLLMQLIGNAAVGLASANLSLRT